MGLRLRAGLLVMGEIVGEAIMEVLVDFLINRLWAEGSEMKELVSLTVQTTPLKEA